MLRSNGDDFSRIEGRDTPDVRNARTDEGLQLQSSLYREGRLDEGPDQGFDPPDLGIFGGPTDREVNVDALTLIRDNIDPTTQRITDREVLKLLADDFCQNRQFWRITGSGTQDIVMVRLSGGTREVTTDTHHEVPPNGVAELGERFLLSRDLWKEWYCGMVMEYHDPLTTPMEDIQQFQAKFDAQKSEVVKSVPMTLEYAIVCLTEELGEVARCIKKMRRSELNDNPDLAIEWRSKMHEEMADLFIYLVILANLEGVRLDDIYFAKQKENLAELEKGGGKFLGTAAEEK